MLRSRTGLRLLLAAIAAAACLAGSPAATAAPPVLSLPGPQGVSEGTRLTFGISASDADGQTPELYAAQLPTGATFVDHRNGTGTFDWTPGTDQSGSHTVLFLADDTFGETDNGSVSIEVSNANTVPVLSPIGSRSVERNTTVFVSLTAFDGDGDALTFSAAGLPSYATLTDYGDGTGSLALAPTSSTPLGQSLVTVSVTDGQGGDSETFTITVTGSSASNPPVLSPIGSQTLAEGTVKHVPVSASDVDGNTLSWVVSLPAFATLTPTGSGAGTLTASLDLTPAFCHAGSYPARVAVSDGSLEDSESFTITVTNVNRSPVWDQAAYAATLVAGGAVSLGVRATDPDQACGLPAPTLSIHESTGGDALSASLVNEGSGGGRLDLRAAAGVVGSYQVTLKASDGSLASLVTVSVTVSEVPPVVAEARAWSDFDPIRLRTGKPRERILLEPVGGSFVLDDVRRETIRLASWGETGTVESIAPLSDGFETEYDRDGNGVRELRMEFGKEDLRALFDYLNERVAGQMTLTATLANGAPVSAPVLVNVYPERLVRIKSIGPNPLNPEASVRIFMEKAGRIQVRVYDVHGRLARTIAEGQDVPAGETIVRFDGKSDRGTTLPSGRYFVHARGAEDRDVKSITILK